MKIYTKTGDKGETSLFGGKRVKKDSIRVEAYGAVDELNSVIGVALTEISNFKSDSIGFKFQISNIQKELTSVQHDLLVIGSNLATPSNISTHKPRALQKRVKEFEKLIDMLTEKLPVLRNFILPGGSNMGAFLHVARSVARRAERRIITLSRKEAIDQEILKYFNRLSDLLFTMARFINHQEKTKEIIWRKSK